MDTSLRKTHTVPGGLTKPDPTSSNRVDDKPPTPTTSDFTHSPECRMDKHFWMHAIEEAYEHWPPEHNARRTPFGARSEACYRQIAQWT
jgi:hypothetical protein